VRGRGSKQQQPTSQLGQKLRSPSEAGKCDSSQPGGTQLEAGLGARMAVHKALLMCLGLPLFLFSAAHGQSHAPPGCSPDLNPLYYNLCDRSEAWGIVLEAVAGAGIITAFVLTIILVASLPFVQDTKKRSLLGTQVKDRCHRTAGTTGSC
uniref:G protein-coupled receptor class C group 5 member C n=1 Tax=Sus scrofa TaxID=9823 RepID=A0A4X1SIU1_PIG